MMVIFSFLYVKPEGACRWGIQCIPNPNIGLLHTLRRALWLTRLLERRKWHDQRAAICEKYKHIHTSKLLSTLDLWN